MAPQIDIRIADFLGDCDECLTFEALLRRFVAEECRAHETRQTQRRAILPWSLAELTAQLATGRAGAADLQPAGPIDPERATAAVLEAFHDGIIVLIVDGQRCVKLDAPLQLDAESHMTIIRRVMLRG